jgi:hypothetical protein
MMPVAASEGVTLFCPKDGKLSFFNSPYPSHRLFTSVDLYPACDFNNVAPSPVRGKVTRVRRVRCPRGRSFQDSGFDSVILLQSLENPERMIKVLHVDPIVECGEAVEPGDGLGRLLRSGYFSFWTEPHLHVEVRSPSDPLRARGGFPLSRLMEVGETAPVEELRGRVTASRPEYVLIALEGELAHGVPADIGGARGLLDGGIPHYGWVGVHVKRASNHSGVVKLCGKPIATVKAIHGNTCLAECTGLNLRVGGVPVGLSLYLFPGNLKPEVKLVPHNPGALKLEESEEISLEIR